MPDHHCTYREFGKGDMRLIDNQKPIFGCVGEIIDQGIGGSPGFDRQNISYSFQYRSHSDFSDHFQIIACSLLNPLRLYQFSSGFELCSLFFISFLIFGKPDRMSWDQSYNAFGG
jgi:hypothetical protein